MTHPSRVTKKLHDPPLSQSSKPHDPPPLCSVPPPPILFDQSLTTLAATGCFLVIIFILFLIVRCRHGSDQSATTNSDSELTSRMETKLLARVTTRDPSRELDQTVRTVYFIISSYSKRTDLQSQGRLS